MKPIVWCMTGSLIQGAGGGVAPDGRQQAPLPRRRPSPPGCPPISSGWSLRSMQLMFCVRHSYSTETTYCGSTDGCKCLLPSARSLAVIDVCVFQGTTDDEYRAIKMASSLSMWPLIWLPHLRCTDEVEQPFCLLFKRDLSVPLFR